MYIFIVLYATFTGLIMGSFSGATVWRIRARQLVEDEKLGEPYDKAELKRLKPLTTQGFTKDRSRCLHCDHTLAWYDLLPLVSWISTGGKCRYCKKPIGKFEPLIELATAVVFGMFTYFWLASYGVSVATVILLGLWLIALTMFIILYAYDQKWFLLPDVIMFPLIALSAVISFLTYYVLGQPDTFIQYIVSIAASVAILSGLYFALWLFSKGRWVGFGDVKLGIALGLLLADWKLALMTLFLANLIGTLVVLPGLLSGKLSRQTQVPFGPLLILAFFISLIFGSFILNGYEAFSTWLSSALLML